MDTQENQAFDNTNQLSSQQLPDLINAYLCKAEALAVIAATIDFDAYSADTINNYFWALSDIVRESRSLCERIMGNIG